MEKVEHSDEIKELMRQINGKEVVFTVDIFPKLRLPAILLAPPDGPLVTVKPLCTPEAIIKECKKHAQGWSITLQRASKPEYCFASHITSESNISILQELAELSVGSDYSFAAVTNNAFSASRPSCPYG